jgi:MAP3K TRAFs-binding domain
VMERSTPDAGVMVKLMLVHRSIGDWSGMIEVHGEMPVRLGRQAPLQQQLGFAYNRRAETKMDLHDTAGAAVDRAEALRILKRLETEQGPTSETSGLIGRIHKSQWLHARAVGDDNKAEVALAQAVGAYVRGFHADWRDVYPGINAVTLLKAQDTEGSRRERDRLLPVVRFAAEQRLGAEPTYWDFATMLEVTVLAEDAEAAWDLVPQVLAARNETWQTASTAANLRIIEGVHLALGAEAGWLTSIIDRLLDS